MICNTLLFIVCCLGEQSLWGRDQIGLVHQCHPSLQQEAGSEVLYKYIFVEWVKQWKVTQVRNAKQQRQAASEALLNAVPRQQAPVIWGAWEEVRSTSLWQGPALGGLGSWPRSQGRDLMPGPRWL